MVLGLCMRRYAAMSKLQILVENKFGAQRSVPVRTNSTNGVGEVTAKDIDRFTPNVGDAVQSNSQAFTFTIPGGQRRRNNR